VMGVFLAGCGLVVAANYVALLMPTDMTWQLDPESGMTRFAGFFTEPNELGALTLATLGAGFGYWPVASRSMKAATAVTMIGALVQCVMADSRSPLIAVAIGCAVYLVFKYRLKGVIAVVVAFGIFYYMAAFAVPSMRAYLDRGDVASFTGRQVAWDFAYRRAKENPLLGYGYEVEGQILKSPYFPGWDEVWSLGYQTSLHDGYLSRAISLGVPALLFWLFLTLRPALTCLFRGRDPWHLRSIVALGLMPVLILNFTESISDFRGFSGVLMALSWAVLERERLFATAQATMRVKAAEAAKAPIVRALQAGAR
jgi:O-antigen ligase